MVLQDEKQLRLKFGVRTDLNLIEDLFEKRDQGAKVSIKKAFEANFAVPANPQEIHINKLIQEFHRRQILLLEEDLFKQKKRLSDATRVLETKVTKKAQNEVEVAGRQMERIKKRLDSYKAKKLVENDSRIFAFDYAPVIVLEDGQRTLKMMRYHLRPPGMPADFDRKYPGCYNARRDSLQGFWKNEFGKKHGLMVISCFYENVKLHDFERRPLKGGEIEKNIVLEFKPKGTEFMFVPCIWDEWKNGEDQLLSFALITDEPPPEVLETGHDRCPIFLKETQINNWLSPNEKSVDELFRILDDREHPYYEHLLAG